MKPQLIYSTKHVQRNRSRQPSVGSEDSAIENSHSESRHEHVIKAKNKGGMRRNSFHPKAQTPLDTSRRSRSGSELSSAGQKSRTPKHLYQKFSLADGKQLSPSYPLLQSDQSSVYDCVKLMVQHKTDAALLIDSTGALTGILTDSDIAYKVVATGKEPKQVRAYEVMTPNPSCISANASAIDALNKMISGKFRHLPVADNEKIVGMLDIAECLYDAIARIQHTYDVSDDKMSEATQKLQSHFPNVTAEELMIHLREKLFLATLSMIVKEKQNVPILSLQATALEAARLMLQERMSAVIICNSLEEVIGIVTSKDLMRRVVANDLNASICEIASIMTAKPYAATKNTTILETLHSMHHGRFLHVPVTDATSKKLVGLVDVLQVTRGVVKQLGSFQRVRKEELKPLWDRFRYEFLNDASRTSEPKVSANIVQPKRDLLVSNIDRNRDRDGSAGRMRVVRMPMETKALSVNSDPTGPETIPEVFVYKVVDQNGVIHRFTSSANDLSALILDVQHRVGDHTIRSLQYVDDDNDHVLLSSSEDLKDTVDRARLWGSKYIRLVLPLHTYKKPSKFVFEQLDDRQESVLGIVYYAAAAAAIAGASFLLSRRR